MNYLAATRSYPSSRGCKKTALKAGTRTKIANIVKASIGDDFGLCPASLSRARSAKSALTTRTPMLNTELLDTVLDRSARAIGVSRKTVAPNDACLEIAIAMKTMPATQFRGATQFLMSPDLRRTTSAQSGIGGGLGAAPVGGDNGAELYGSLMPGPANWLEKQGVV
jgi:hypothetical protein